MDNGIFGLAMYNALKRDDIRPTSYIETKKGRVTLEDLVKFYEEHTEEKKVEKDERSTEEEAKFSKQPEMESISEKENVRTRKRRPRNRKETL